MENTFLIILLIVVLLCLVIYDMTMIGLMSSQTEKVSTKSAEVTTKRNNVNIKYKLA